MRRILIGILLLAGTALPCSFSFTKSVYSKHPGSSSALFRFERNGKVGFIDAAGKEIIPAAFIPGFFAEEDFFEGLSPAQKSKDHWGFINEQGKWVVEPSYWRVDYFSEGLAAVTGQLQLYDFPKSYIDRAGKPVIKLPEDVGDAGPFSEGVARIQLKGYNSVGMVGYMDRTGKMIVPPQFARAGDFHSGLARVVLDGQCFVVEENGSHEAPPAVPPLTGCGGISDEIKVRCREGYIDKSGDIQFEFQGTRDFSENLAAVSVKGKWGYINSQGTMIVEPQFDEALKFSEGLAAVRQKSLWGYINHDGVTVIPLRFADGNSFSNGVGRVNGGYVDKAGRFMPSTFADESDFVQGLAHVSLGSDEYGYIDKSGKILFRFRAKSARK